MDDILGKAIDAVDADTNTKSQNDNDSDSSIQNDTSSNVESGMDIDVLGDLLNESEPSAEKGKEPEESDGEDSLDVLADLGIDFSEDEPYETQKEEPEPKSNDAQDDVLDDIMNSESAPAHSEADEGKDDLDILDGEDGLVEDDSIDVDDLIGQVKGEGGEEEPKPTHKESDSNKEAADDIDPLSDFGKEDPLNMDFENDSSLDEDPEEDSAVIEPEFDDENTDLGDFEDDEVTNIEPDIDDDFMKDDAVDSQDDDVIDITDDSEDFPEKPNKSFKPHTEVEDVEDMLTGGVGSIFSTDETPISNDPDDTALTEEQVEGEPKAETDGGKQEPSKPDGKEEEPAKESGDEEVKPKAKTFGVKGLVISIMASSLISLGGGLGAFYAFGDKFMDKHSYIDSEALDKKMASVLDDFEKKLKAKADVQATKTDLDAQVSEVAANVSAMLNKYNGEIETLREKMNTLSQKQGVDKAELEALSSQSITLLTQFVDDVKEAQMKVSEEVYAKVIKTVRQEFSERDNTVKLDELIGEVSRLKDSETRNESKLQTAMNLIGVLESDSDFMSRRLAAVEVGAEQQPTNPTSSQILKKGYKDSDGENWAYIEVETKDGVKSGSHFKYGNSSSNDPKEANTLPYVLKGVFDIGTKAKPKYKVYVSPRASKNATPVGYAVGQQVPGMGRIINVEPTGGNEKIPYVVTTEIGVLKGDQ